MRLNRSDSSPERSFVDLHGLHPAADIFLRISDPSGKDVAQGESDRRQHPRFLCGGEAEIRSLAFGLCARGMISNLSLGGCRIQLGNDHRFRRGEAVEMTFCVRQLPVRVQGSVRQVHSDQAIGVEFTMLSQRGKRQLQELIEELAEILRDQVESLKAGGQ